MPPKIDMSREESAEREIGVTHFSSGVKIVLIVLFLGTILAIPCIQATRGFGASWNAVRSADSSGILGRLSSISHFLKTGFEGIESSLEKNSLLTKAVLPAVQTFAFRFLGLGNEKVYVARAGWLYYRPDVDYILEGGIAPSQRIAKATATLVQFDAELKSQGIRLLVVPVPVKPVVEFRPLAVSPSLEPLHNASYQKFLSDLGANGVEVFDPTSILIETRNSSGLPQYLKTDTHWTPSAMESVAEALAKRISPTPEPPRAMQKSAPLQIQNSGDLATMLQLHPEANLAIVEDAEIHPVSLADGSVWRPDPASEVLLLGDSFTNIFSTPDLGWGESAGFAEHLSWHLAQPIDRIAINAGGSLSVRQALARNPERLTGKKTVIYQFAVRELTSGDWRPVSIPKNVSKKPALESSSVLEGVVKAVSRLPAPGSVPYKDALLSLHLGEIHGNPQSEALIFFKGMTANVPTESASLKVGERIRVGVVPWESVENKFGAITRIELDGEAAELDAVYWAEEMPAMGKP